MSVVRQLAAKPSVFPVENGEIPPLESGDRLTRAEFMRCYDAMPDLTEARRIGRSRPTLSLHLGGGPGHSTPQAAAREF